MIAAIQFEAVSKYEG